MINLALFIIFLIFDYSSQQTKCGISPLNNFTRMDYLITGHRLVGGIESKPHQWPWTGELISAVLSEKENFTISHRCGVALIDEQFVITAAHCFAKSRLPSRYRVLLGGHKIFTGREFNVVNISIHTLYQIQASAFDVALLKIEPKVVFNEKILPICLPIFPPLTNVVCVVTGWGRLKENGERAKTLREIHVPIISPFTCNDFRHYAGRLHPPSMVCAGFENGRTDACQGDSGGPLQCQNSQGIWELQGVVSWGVGCGQPSFPGVYTKIAIAVPWIRFEMFKLTRGRG